MQTVAIIPARGGSKRIPRKNIRPFCGKPMIARSIEAALQSGVFEAVVVSTDDEEIAAVAESCGALAPFRARPNCRMITPLHCRSSPMPSAGGRKIARPSNSPAASTLRLHFSAPSSFAKDFGF
jgi:hypothetical protein